MTWLTVPSIAMHGVHHALQHRIEELPGLLGIAVGEEFHRALEVGKQHGDLLALAFQGAAGGEDFLGEIGNFCISPRKGIFHSLAESFPHDGLSNNC